MFYPGDWLGDYGISNNWNPARATGVPIPEGSNFPLLGAIP
jgi:hypothetical protein